MQNKTKSDDSRWSSRSLGSKFQHGIFYALIRVGGRRSAYVLLYCVVFWYVLFYPSVRRKAGYYLNRRFPGEGWFKRFMHVYKTCLAMGEALVDRAIVGILGGSHVKVSLHGKKELLDLLDEDKGLILINAHVGCWQVALSAMDFMDVPVNMLMQIDENDVDRRYFEHAGIECPYNVIDPGGYLGGTLEMMKVLQKKQILSVMGDRIFGNPKNSLPCEFLGGQAYIPISAFTLAAATGTPCAILLSHKIAIDHYVLELAKVIRPKRDGGGRKRKDHLRQAVRETAETLEKFCKDHPHQFFNFFDMWTLPKDENFDQ